MRGNESVKIETCDEKDLQLRLRRAFRRISLVNIFNLQL
jgi:hypothetical protein